MDSHKEVIRIPISPPPPLSSPKWSVVAVLVLMLVSHTSGAQVLISLVFGDKLNSNKIEFGLDGGISMSNLEGLPISKPRTAFNLGFYFDIKLRDTSWMVHTGVMVKSSFGARKLPVYSL